MDQRSLNTHQIPINVLENIPILSLA
jgi:hypothetical protein